MWASKHDNRDVENAGLNMCIELLNNIAETDTQTSNAFFQRYFVSIMQDIFFVLTDADHKAGRLIQISHLRIWKLTFRRLQGSNYASSPHVLICGIWKDYNSTLHAWTSSSRNYEPRISGGIR